MHSYVKTNWFLDLFLNRDGLPLELTSLVELAQEESLDSIISNSLAHVERLLSFKLLLEDLPISDGEQFWTDLVIRIEDASYYASMALPFLRQALEFDTDYQFSPSDSIDFGEYPEVEIAEICMGKFVPAKQNIVNSAFTLALFIDGIELENLSDKEAFINSCRSIYLMAAEILILSHRIMVYSDE